MAFDNSGKKAVWAARLGTTPKRCELPLFFAGIRQAVRRLKGPHLRRLNMQFQQDWPKDKKLQFFQIFGGKLRKILLHWALWSGSRGIDNFSLSQLFGSTSMESCQLAYLKYAIFSSTGHKTKKLPPSKLFLSMVFKHGLLEGSTSEQMWSTVFPRGWDAR